MNHPEIAAMQGIVDAFAELTTPQRQAVARNLTASSDPEIAALERSLAALKDVKGAPARARVIRWAMDAYKAPKQARKPKASADKPAEKDRTIDLRAVVQG